MQIPVCRISDLGQAPSHPSDPTRVPASAFSYEEECRLLLLAMSTSGSTTRHLTSPRHSTASVTRVQCTSAFIEGEVPPLVSPPQRWTSYPSPPTEGAKLCLIILIWIYPRHPTPLRFYTRGKVHPCWSNNKVGNMVPSPSIRHLPVSLHPPFYTRRNADSCCWRCQPRGRRPVT